MTYNFPIIDCIKCGSCMISSFFENDSLIYVCKNHHFTLTINKLNHNIISFWINIVPNKYIVRGSKEEGIRVFKINNRYSLGNLLQQNPVKQDNWKLTQGLNNGLDFVKSIADKYAIYEIFS